MIGSRAIAGAWISFRAPPSYPATASDTRTIDVAGLDLPVRATVAVTVVILALLLDYSRTLMPGSIAMLGRSADGMLARPWNEPSCSGWSRSWWCRSGSGTACRGMA